MCRKCHHYPASAYFFKKMLLMPLDIAWRIKSKYPAYNLIMRHPKIIADSREIFSGIPSLLQEMADVEIRQLPVADYILSGRVAVERKRARDFLDSLIRKRIFEQVTRLREAYEKPLLIIEDEGLFSRNVDRRAIYGAIACFLTDYEISVVRTRDAEETAMLLYAISAREQFKRKRDIALRGEKVAPSFWHCEEGDGC